MDTQLSFLPLDSPDSVANETDRVLRRLRRLAPALRAHECLFVLGELALLQLALDTVEHHVVERARWDARHLKPISYSPIRREKLA